MEKFYSVILIDDNKQVHIDFKALVKENKSLHGLLIEGCFFDCRSARNFLKKRGGVDLVLCDIALENENGLEEASSFFNLTSFFLFVTVFDNFWGEAMKVGANGYITKPINPKKLREKIDELEKLRQSGRVIDDVERLIYVKDIHLPQLVKIRLNSIVALTVDEVNHVRISRENDHYIVRKSLASYKKEFLQTHLFVQLEQSVVIAIQHVKRLEGNVVYMTNGMFFSVSRNYKPILSSLQQRLDDKIAEGGI